MGLWNVEREPDKSVYLRVMWPPQICEADQPTLNESLFCALGNFVRCSLVILSRLAASPLSIALVVEGVKANTARCSRRGRSPTNEIVFLCPFARDMSI